MATGSLSGTCQVPINLGSTMTTKRLRGLKQTSMEFYRVDRDAYSPQCMNRRIDSISMMRCAKGSLFESIEQLMRYLEQPRLPGAPERAPRK